MSHAIDSKSAAALLIDPMNAPEPSAEDGPGSHFGNTFAPASEINGITPSPTASASSNPYRKASTKTSPPQKHAHSTSKSSATASIRSSSGGSPRAQRPYNHRVEAFADFDTPPTRNRASSQGTPPSYQEATSNRNSPTSGNSPDGSTSTSGRRRGSSLRERYPGDLSAQPLDMIRRDSKKAYRSPHLRKRTLPGADSIDRLDPAVGGRAYHHEGPYDAALLARNRDPRTAPLNAIQDSNAETLRATPRENIKDAVERHKPLDGVAVVPPGQVDRFGRRYDYVEGADLMHESSSGDPGYKRWANKDYDAEDLKGEAEPGFSLNRALRAHRITDDSIRQDGSIELEDRSGINREYHDAERNGRLDTRDPVDIAGGEGRYVDMEIAASGSTSESHVKRNSLGGTLKKRIGSLRKKDRDD